MSDAVADGLSDTINDDEEPEQKQPTVIDVDVTGELPDPDDTVIPDGATVSRLPVRRTPPTHPDLGTLVPLQEELLGVAQLAVTLATSQLVPKVLRDHPADVLAIILTGRELGVAPMTACRMFHVINGTVTLPAKVRMAMVRERGLGKVYSHQPPVEVPCPLIETRDPHDDDCPRCHGAGIVTRLCPCGNPTPSGSETDPDVSTWHAERHDMPGIIFTSTYSTAMAMQVEYEEWVGGGDSRRKIKKKLGDKDNWQNYPAQMCQWRSLGYVLDQAFSEVGTGLYQPDEVGAVTDEDGQPILDVESTEVLVPSDTSPAAKAREASEQRRRERTAAGTGGDAPASPDTVASFKARIAGLSRYEGAPEALAELWKQKVEHPMKDLLYAECKTVAAIIDMVERRCQKGDFGEPGPEPEEQPPADEPAAAAEEPASEPAQAAQEAQEAPPAAERPELPFDPSTLPEGRTAADDLLWANAAPEELVTEVAGQLKDVSSDEIDSRLKALELPTTGAPEKRKARVAVHMIRHRMERMIAGDS